MLVGLKLAGILFKVVFYPNRIEEFGGYLIENPFWGIYYHLTVSISYYLLTNTFLLFISEFVAETLDCMQTEQKFKNSAIIVKEYNLKSLIKV